MKKEKLDSYDVQEILRCIEVNHAIVSEKLGRPSEVYAELRDKWHRVMDELGVSRYGSHDAAFEVVESKSGVQS